jgi:NAD(P)-dependent dehydrogenase (short-subunit alcohol dehydrogenase family)
MDVAGKVALITGGARIGQAVAHALAGRGCDLALTYRRSRAAAEAAAHAARTAGVRAEMFCADVTDEAQVAAAVRDAEHALGRLDIVVNLASTYVPTPFEDAAARTFDDAMACNARSIWLFALHAVPAMRRAGGGRIVNVSDWLPVSGRPRYRGYSAYYASKGAVTALTESLALELAPDILVNAVAPGPILAPPDLAPEEDAAVRRATPLGRWGGSDEIARAVLFLVETDFITGESIRVDGGRHLA